MTSPDREPRGGLDALLRPSSIAVIGATEQPGTVGELVVRYLRKHGFEGTIYPVNPKRATVSGMRAYPTLRDVPGSVDTVVLAIPQQHVRENIEAAAEVGAGAVVVFSAGFADVGEDGRAAQRELVEIARRGGMRVVGPNCVGVVNIKEGRYCAFSKIGDRDNLFPGPVAIVSQSGALGGSLLDRLQDAGIGVGYMVSTGNEADVEVGEVIDELLDDDSIGVVAAFVEQFRDPARIRAVGLRAARLGKPLLVLKTGVSEVGQAAIASHTGALATGDVFYEGLMRQHGIIRVQSLDDLYHTIVFIAKAGVPAGPRVGVLSLSGGAGALSADACSRVGLELPVPSDKTQARLAERIPAFGSVENPADTSGMTFSDPGLFPFCMETFGEDEGFDSVVTVMTAVGGEMGAGMARSVAQVGDASPVPMASIWLAGSTSDSCVDIIRPSRVATFRSIDDCYRSIARAVDFGQRRERLLKGAPAEDSAAPDPEAAAQLVAQPDGVLPEPVSARILAGYGVPFPRQHIAASPDEAVRLAGEIGGPVALKVVASGLAHKDRSGGVVLGLDGEQAVREAYERITRAIAEHEPDAQVEGMLVAEMVSGNLELLVGAQRDPLFGPAVLVGLGGVSAEVLNDTSLRLPPFGADQVEDMLGELRAYAALTRAGLLTPAVVGTVVDVVLAVARFVTDFADVVESVDLNPLIVDAKNGTVRAVDALIVKAGMPAVPTGT